MNCNDNFNSVSVHFNRANRTLYPVEANIQTGVNSYQTFYCKFDAITAREMSNDDLLNDTQRATVNIGGNPTYSMLYRPEYLKVGESSEDHEYDGFLELHDLHERLKDGKVVYSPRTTTAKETFTEILDSRNNTGIITGYDIRSDDKATPSLSNSPDLNLSGFFSEELDVRENSPIHFDGDTPFEANEFAKKKHGTVTHINSEGKFIVGNYTDNSDYTVSTSGYNSDLHMKSASASTSYQEARRLTIQGPKIHGELDNESGLADFADSFSLPSDENNLRVTVKIENEAASEEGAIKEKRATNVNPYTVDLIDLGKVMFRGMDMNTGQGSVTLNMNNSNIDPRDLNLKIGSNLTVRSPPNNCLYDKEYDIEGNYSVTGVRHRIGSTWDIRAEIANGLVPLNNLTSEIKLWDVETGQDYTWEEVHGYEQKEGERVSDESLNQYLDG